jgi:hypothetical protein
VLHALEPSAERCVVAAFSDGALVWVASALGQRGGVHREGGGNSTDRSTTCSAQDFPAVRVR